MINPGIINTLTIVRETDNGLYLEDSEQNEVLLPNRYVPENYTIGDKMEVFVYFDSEDRIVATTDTPKIMVGQIEALEVVGMAGFGAFLDWGLPKDLLVPRSNQAVDMVYGGRYPVMAYIDNVSGRIVATSKLHHYVKNETITVHPKEQVEILLAQRRDRGFRVIINGKHWGMLYDNQIFTPMRIGDKARAWVYKIADDGRIDVSLQQQGLDQVVVATDAIMELVNSYGGVLPFGDKSTPEEIQAATGMSKKVFKRAVGYLMRQGRMVVGDFTCELVEKN